MRAWQYLVASLLGMVAVLPATEKASPALQRERQTSGAREISIKPLFVYSARGRRDPFVFDMTLPGSSQAVSRNFNIAALKLVGFLGGGGSKVALFRDAYSGKTYRFRAGRLFSPEGLAMTDVKGGILEGRQVSLSQGESSILFMLPGNPKINSLEATVAQDRKEQQR